MNKRLGIVRRFVLLNLLAAILCLNIPVSYASTHESISKEKLYSLNSSQLVSLLEDNGLRLPQDYAEHRELASSFVSKYTPLIIRGKVNPYVPMFNYEQSNQMMLELANALSRIKVINQPTTYSRSLQDSTVRGSWSDSYNNYNCYAHSLYRTNGLQPGQTSNTSFSLTMSISKMADVVLKDLDAMGYWGYKTTTKPTSKPDKWFIVICIRKDTNNEDYHFMRAETLNSWSHKPGGTQPLDWKYSSPGYKVWTNEYVYKGVVYPGEVSYESEIYYILYKGKNDPGIQPAKLKNLLLNKKSE